MKKLWIAWDPVYAHPLPEGHRFPMVKYEQIPGQLLREGTVRPEQVFSPAPCPESVIVHTHDPRYLDKLLNQTLSPSEQRAIGFPQSPALTFRERVITQGTIDCCERAFENGVALNVAGGTHHAFSDRGEGFCLLNDFAVAARWLLQQQRVERILIVDLDVHQGNGTARIFQQESRVFTFSMHGAHNYPFRKETSDLDIPLADGTDDATYLGLLAQHLPPVIDRHRPDLVFYLSGVDILATDRFGKLAISPEGCRQRDQLVFSALRSRGIPCVVAMGGGYSPDVNMIVEAHCQTFRAARETWDLW